MAGMGILLGLALTWSGTAEAHGHPHYRPAPRAHTRVVVASPRPTVTLRWGPWAVNYRPAPRAGYVWVSGAWVGAVWYPGHWRPAAPPPASGQVWVDGHWEGDTYVDGYWRIDHIDGMVWVDGGYDAYGDYVEGYWVGEETHGTPPAPTAVYPDADEDAPLAIPMERGGR